MVVVVSDHQSGVLSGNPLEILSDLQNKYRRLSAYAANKKHPFSHRIFTGSLTGKLPFLMRMVFEIMQNVVYLHPPKQYY